MLVGRDDDGDDDVLLRRLTRCEEDRRRLYPTAATTGFRWFRSPNVVDLEAYRRRAHGVPAQPPIQASWRHEAGGMTAGSDCRAGAIRGDGVPRAPRPIISGLNKTQRNKSHNSSVSLVG